MPGETMSGFRKSSCAQMPHSGTWKACRCTRPPILFRAVCAGTLPGTLQGTSPPTTICGGSWRLQIERRERRGQDRREGTEKERERTGGKEGRTKKDDGALTADRKEMGRSMKCEVWGEK